MVQKLYSIIYRLEIIRLSNKKWFNLQFCSLAAKPVMKLRWTFENDSSLNSLRLTPNPSLHFNHFSEHFCPTGRISATFIIERLLFENQNPKGLVWESICIAITPKWDLNSWSIEDTMISEFIFENKFNEKTQAGGLQAAGVLDHSSKFTW